MDIKEATIQDLCKELSTRASALLVVGHLNSNRSKQVELVANTVGTPLDVSYCLASLLDKASQMSEAVIENRAEPDNSTHEIAMTASDMVQGVVNSRRVLESMETFRGMEKTLKMNDDLKSTTKHAMFAKLAMDMKDTHDKHFEDTDLAEEDEHEDN